MDSQATISTAVGLSTGPNFTAIRFASNSSLVLVTATGTNPRLGYKTYFQIGPEMIQPPILNFINTPPTGPSGEQIAPYSCWIAYPLGDFPHNDVVAVHTAQGVKSVPVIDETALSPMLAKATGGVSLRDFHAIIDRMPGSTANFYVEGIVTAPGTDWTAKLVEAVPQGINPDIKLLNLEISVPKNTSGSLERVVRYDEKPPKHPYTEVQIAYQRMKVVLEVQIVT